MATFAKRSVRPKQTSGRLSEQAYRDKWKWDDVVRGSHAVDCYPSVGSCPYWVYMKDGEIQFEEQSGAFPIVEEGVPDFNPMGCQKGSCWHQLLTAKERVLYPLKRVGERGSGKWERISWDTAMEEIADSILDAIQEIGPEAIFSPNGANACAYGVMTQRRFSAITGTLLADFDSEVGDFSPGMYLTFGKLTAASEDDYVHSELILIWHCNPSYTRIPYYHFLTEARYKGAEVVLIAPDYNASAVNTDYHIPVKVGSDAAFCLSMCKVIVDEGLMDSAFVKEQTDLSLLVRLDTRHFLRANEIEDEGRDDQFYFYDQVSKRVVEAPRGTLALGEVDPALEGTYQAVLASGEEVAVVPVFELVKERLAQFEPEMATTMCGVHPDVIRSLARKVASKKTHVYEGLATGKHYHGDLMGRSMYLLLAMTGNWGKKGTGPTYWNVPPSTAGQLDEMRRSGTREELEQLLAGYDGMLEAVKAQDPTQSTELAAIEGLKQVTAATSKLVPPVWWWYYHVGFRELWNKRDWHDPSMKREFDDYFNEALEKGWWQGVAMPLEDQPPRVMMHVGDNLLRRARGGKTMFLKHLWPKLKCIFTIDVRMSTTAMYSDYVLPAAQQYERPSAMGLAHTLFFTMADKAVEPAGEAKPEWQVFRLLCRKMTERAKARGMTEYQDRRGNVYSLEDLESVWTAGGTMVDEEEMTAQGIEGSSVMGTLPEGTTIETLREKGVVRYKDWGFVPYAQSYATDIKPDETMTPFRRHIERKDSYPTLTRRAQFYIDHDWFLEAGEELPTHKDPPKMGGDYPLVLTSGHGRWSIHANNIANKLMLETHRGRPHIVMNHEDAAKRGIADDDQVRVHNDMGMFLVRVKLASSVRPGQVICYNGWDHYQFKDWHGPNDIEGAMVKWLGFAGGYGHLRYWPFMWSPTQVDRATRVEVSRSA
ncbi:MAG: molybdopterin-dependent oxidoreductase [Chloroflexi bacterium]|nr:molybdopterin-dependent oxidoreductase [Chloroflexota bacterium]